jgi:hypothetical protein
VCAQQGACNSAADRVSGEHVREFAAFPLQ